MALAQSFRTEANHGAALGPYRVVYNSHSDGLFRLIPNSSPGANSLSAAQPPPSACSMITSGTGGTSGYLPYFTNTCIIEISSIFQSSGHIGIGNTSPLGTFTVGTGSSAFTINSVTTGTGDIGTGAWLRNNGTDTVLSTNVGNLYLGWSGSTKTIYIGGASGVGSPVQLAGNAPVPSLIMNSSGYVGIGVSSGSLTNVLQVNGANAVYSTGSGGGYKFADRQAADTETSVWYNNYDLTRLYRSDVTSNTATNAGTGDVLAISNSGPVGQWYTSSPDNVYMALAGALTVQGPTPWTDVTAYGAACDGTTDDTVAIQNAINATLPGGASIFQRGTDATLRLRVR